MDRRDFLKGIFGVAAGAAVPAPLMAAIDELAKVVALPEEEAAFRIEVSMDEGKTWVSVPVRGRAEKRGAWNSCELAEPITVYKDTLIRLVVTAEAYQTVGPMASMTFKEPESVSRTVGFAPWATITSFNWMSGA